jgi:hypothetical protein
MFDKKVSNLLNSPTITTENLFIKEGLKTSNETLSGNGALKYSTSGNDFVDNFSAISTFKNPRTYNEVSLDMFKLWNQDPTLCLKLAVYIRMITRASKVVNSEYSETLEVQRGQGLKHEGIMRMLWLAVNQPNTFKENIHLLIAAGSWNDVFKMLNLDLQYHGWNNKKLDWNFFLNVIRAGIINPATTNLVRKYLPTIRTNKKATTLESASDTLIGRWLARKLFSGFEKIQALKTYRKLKSSGTAHTWQQAISKQLYDQINFDTIAGRALQLLANSKFLENHNLVEAYTKWIEAQPLVKFTGYVFELFNPLGRIVEKVPLYQKHTINAQFKQLVETGKQNISTTSKLLVVRDVSGSMLAQATGCKVSSYVIAKAMALYFSEFLTGAFANSYAQFSRTCTLLKWVGDTPVDKYINDTHFEVGNTNFQSIIDLFIQLKRKGVPESDFPEGILCISDGEFDRLEDNTVTNFNCALKKLREAGFSDAYVDNFKIILWDIPNGYYNKVGVAFEDFADSPNFFYLSGYDPSVISFILGTPQEGKSVPKNAQELFESAMNQTLLNMLTIIQ